MKTNYAQVSEWMWLLISLGTLGIALYFMYVGGLQEWPYLLITAVCFVMYLFRRMFRIRMQNNRHIK